VLNFEVTELIVGATGEPSPSQECP